MFAASRLPFAVFLLVTFAEATAAQAQCQQRFAQTGGAQGFGVQNPAVQMMANKRRTFFMHHFAHYFVRKSQPSLVLLHQKTSFQQNFQAGANSG